MPVVFTRRGLQGSGGGHAIRSLLDGADTGSRIQSRFDATQTARDRTTQYERQLDMQEESYRRKVQEALQKREEEMSAREATLGIVEEMMGARMEQMQSIAPPEVMEGIERRRAKLMDSLQGQDEKVMQFALREFNEMADQEVQEAGKRAGAQEMGALLNSEVYQPFAPQFEQIGAVLEGGGYATAEDLWKDIREVQELAEKDYADKQLAATQSQTVMGIKEQFGDGNADATGMLDALYAQTSTGRPLSDSVFNTRLAQFFATKARASGGGGGGMNRPAAIRSLKGRNVPAEGEGGRYSDRQIVEENAYLTGQPAPPGPMFQGGEALPQPEVEGGGGWAGEMDLTRRASKEDVAKSFKPKEPVKAMKEIPREVIVNAELKAAGGGLYQEGLDDVVRALGYTPDTPPEEMPKEIVDWLSSLWESHQVGQDDPSNYARVPEYN